VTAEASPAPNEAAPRPARPVRVVVVDDNPDVRALLRIQFRRDPRFEVVGEAGDGSAAIDVAGEAQPDLMVLDRQMPRMNGVDAIPGIRQRAPGTAIVLYTAVADVPTYYAALAAGAIDVVEKAGPVSEFVDRLVRALLDRSSGRDAAVEVRVGPVPSAAARVWVPNTEKILAAVKAHPEVLERPVPADVFELFDSLLRQWDEIAETTEEFRWAARASAVDVSRIVEYWALIDRMTDEDLELLGIHWSPPEGEVFFRALTAGVLQALGRHQETQRLAALLSEQWAPYQDDASG